MKFIKLTSKNNDNKYLINVYDILYVIESIEYKHSTIQMKDERIFEVKETVQEIQELIKQSEFGYLSDFCNYLPKHKDNNQDAPFLGKPYCK